ncbi:major facilitator transporter [Reticulomyxa filosa]|uniref:Major facilitator transporter n=1 Tax=Reticulomyxa filosa TaxID=46433 RepID=X6NV28_RETFI|nr:major facilitator transporter [Reticulomyxa filosa]|eukprot:ETO29127.1 major facilitator transporter [Reticulomyxa filosa]
MCLNEIIEFYDWGLLGYFASGHRNKYLVDIICLFLCLFFCWVIYNNWATIKKNTNDSEVGNALYPKASDSVHAIEVYAVYAIGFFFRPLGGIVFGYIGAFFLFFKKLSLFFFVGKKGDTVGRQVALRLSISLMGVATFLTGCIPSYNTIGWFAPCLLIGLRLFQAVCTGGECSSATIYVYELAPKGKKPFAWVSFRCRWSGPCVRHLHMALYTKAVVEMRTS